MSHRIAGLLNLSRRTIPFFLFSILAMKHFFSLLPWGMMKAFFILMDKMAQIKKMQHQGNLFYR